MTYLGDQEFYAEVRQGKVAGYSMVHKYGRNGNVPDGTWQFINRLGFTAWPLSAPTTVRIKAGGNANDTAAGTGSREIIVEGIDDSFNETTEAIVTAGASASAATSKSFWRIHRAWSSAVGTYEGANLGTVVIENSGGGTDLIEIGGAEKGQTQYGAWSVPIGKTAYWLTAHMGVDTNKSANVRVYTRDDFDVTVAPMKSKRLRSFFPVKGKLRYAPKGPEFAMPAKSDFWFEASGDGAACAVIVNFELLVVDD